MLGIFSKILGGLSGPLGSLAGVFIDRVADAIWKRLDERMKKNDAFVADSKEIADEAKLLDEELEQATHPEEFKNVLKKIHAFHGRIGKR